MPLFTILHQHVSHYFP